MVNGVNTRDEKTGRFIKGTASDYRKNYDGKVYGDLTVLSTEFSGKTGGKTYCICQCSCGNIKKVSASNLQQGKATNCGCKSMEQRAQHFRKDYTGQKFNHLLIEEIYWELGTRTKCKCLCDCGNEVVLTMTDVKCGHTKSCGCTRYKESAEHTAKDWTGVIAPSGVEFLRKSRQREKGQWLWICKCGMCGKEFEALPANINDLTTSSCGCKIVSSGEQIIKNILDEFQIPYIQQYSFPDCKNIYKLRFDFAIINSQSEVEMLIEYDGKQHYEPIDFFGGEDGFKKNVERDATKNKYCEENNIPLIRIPYSYDYEIIYNKLSNIL